MTALTEKTDGWLCRDANGELYFYDGVMPENDEDGYWYSMDESDRERFIGGLDCLPEVKAGMQPVKATYEKTVTIKT